MMYAEGERDMVMLQHRFGIELADGTKVNEEIVQFNLQCTYLMQTTL
jgi:hypothetical protein